MEKKTIFSNPGDNWSKSTYYYAEIETVNEKYHYKITNEDVFFNTKYEETVLKLNTKYYDENFMNIIIDFVLPVISQQNFRHRNIYFDYNKNSKHIDGFVKEHLDDNKTYTIEELTKLFLLIDNSCKSITDNEVDKLLKIYKDNKYGSFQGYSTFEKNIRYTRPYYADLCYEEIQIVNASKLSETSVGKDNIKLMYKIHMIMNDPNADDNIIIKDYTINKDTVIKTTYSSTTKLPFKSLKFYNFINNLTIGDMKKIYKSMPSNVSNKVVINIANDIIKQEKNELTMIDVGEIYLELIKKSNGSLGNYPYSYLNNFFLKNHNAKHDNKKATAMMIYTYIKNKDVITTHDFNSINSCFIKNPAQWIKKPTVSMYIFNKLVDITDFFTAVDIIIDASNERVELTPAQWEKFIENYDEYKDMPVSWWLNFIK